jgi:molybdenum cofactor guanylyltransferase
MTTRVNSGLSAVVLCGGKSLRAGFDKQTIIIDGQWIALWIAHALAQVFDDVLLVTNRSELYANSGFRVASDIIPNAGPLGGIHAGLTNAKHDWVFVTACDMPNVSNAYLRWMAGLARETTAEAIVVQQENGFLEPMNAFYRKSCLSEIQRALLGGERRIADFLEKIGTHYLPEQELRPFGTRETLFFNMNTPEEIGYYFTQQETQFPAAK